MIKVFPDGREETWTRRVNPTCHIPENTVSVHHITDDDVKDCPTFKEISHEVWDYIDGCDFAGFNSNKFDIPLLIEEFQRCGMIFDTMKHKFIDVQNIYHKLEQRTLAAAYKFYCGSELTNAHSAEADARATMEVLKAQLDHYPESQLKNDVDFLADYSRLNQNIDFAGRFVMDENNVERINFGKHKGRSLREVLRKEPNYYTWMMQGDFSQNTKQVLSKIWMSERLKLSESKKCKTEDKDK